MSSFLLPEVLAERGRVSQGNPSLSPERRATITYRAKQREKSQALAADGASKQKALTAPDGKRDTTSYEAQAGLELEPYVIMCRLRKLNHQLHFEPSTHDSQKMGIYLLDPLAGKRFLCGMERERKMPEFSVRQVIPFDLSTGQRDRFRETRGWRSVLSKLIRCRAISQAKAEVMFGPPNRESELWQLRTN
jgi:hypothetical protein